MGNVVTGAIARNVRALRSGHGWSLDALAQRSGVSKGMLVQVEQGSANPTVGTLSRIAEALDVSIARLLDLGEQPAVRVVRAAETVTLWRDDSGSHGDLLLGMDRREHVELWSWHLLPGSQHAAEEQWAGTREMLHVLEGRLRLSVGSETWDLGPGDAALFSADRPHVYANTGSVPTRFQMVGVMPPAGRSG